MDPPSAQEAQTHKSEALNIFSSSINSPRFPSSISKLSGSSRGIPCNKDFYFYFNFDEFKNPIREIAKNSQSILETIGSSAEKLWGKKHDFPNDSLGGVDDDDDEAYDWLVNFNDELFERLDFSVDEFNKIRKKEEETGVRAMDDDGFQLVRGKKKKVFEKDLLANSYHTGSIGDNNLVNSSSVKVVSRDSKAMGTPKSKVSFHIASIPRPQDEYKILVNNSNQPFEHVWLQRSEDGSRVIHPLENLSIMDFIDKTVSDVEPVKPTPVESTSFKLVQEVRDLKELAAKLHEVNEFAVDLEHNQYRSFQGLTCLMQISTRTEDFIVDTLKLRIHIGPYLREVFKDPSKRKVMHGADRDIIWLQRDFGIYVCNLFDTGQASKVLKMERKSLEHLLQYFCGVAANKEYQNADWRLRPLTNEMLRYAREDTHYLLYIYDLMKIKLLQLSTDPNCPEALVEVYQRSYDVCTQLYQKDVLTESSYLNIYGLHAADLNNQQLAIVAGLCEWRDVIARAEDESTGYILPNKVLIEIAKQMPVTPGKLRHVLKSKLPYIERNLGAVVSIIRHSMQNAAAYEAVAKKLKEERIEMEAARAKKRAEEEAAEASVTSTGAAAGAESVGNAMETDSFETEVGNFIAGVNRNVKLDGSSRASVEVKKQPSSAFGAMFGKRKFDLDKKATEEIKVEQIKSSVSLPFRSFTEPLPSAAKEPSAKAQESPNREEPSATTGSSPNPEQDIILLESDSDAEEEQPDPAANPNAEPNPIQRKTEDENNIILLDSDSDQSGDEEPMSLSDLSSSFKKCLKTKAEEKEKGGESSEGVAKVEPFDYAAARKEARFGEDGGAEGEGGRKGKAERGAGKKAAGGGRKEGGGGERSGDFEMGKRRQAFPATGNRSTTFR